MLIILMYWAETYILLRKNIASLLVGSKEVGLEVNGDKTKNMVMSEIRTQGEFTV